MLGNAEASTALNTTTHESWQLVFLNRLLG
jgi:hypothetical protein